MQRSVEEVAEGVEMNGALSKHPRKRHAECAPGPISVNIYIAEMAHLFNGRWEVEGMEYRSRLPLTSSAGITCGVVFVNVEWVTMRVNIHKYTLTGTSTRY